VSRGYCRAYRRRCNPSSSRRWWATRFDRLYAGLSPALRASIARLSPLAGATRLRASVEIASAPHESTSSLSETEALARAARHTRVRLTVTSTLDHAIPSLSLSDIADLFRFNGWAVRLMHALRANRLTLGSAIGLPMQARSPTAGTARIGHLKHF
jgi:hypothetical protein